MIDLGGKTVLVTGGTGHLGFPIAIGLRELGATVIATARDDRKTDKLEALRGNGIEVCYVDLADETSIADTFARLKSDRTRIHGLVNNAYFGEGGSLETMTIDQWRSGIDGAVGVAFTMLQSALPFLKETKGAVVNVASIYGIVSPDPRAYAESPQFNNPPNYGAGKAALIQFTKYAACYLAKYAIRVNAISPGAFPSGDVRQDLNFISRLENKIPLGRIGNPEELVTPVAFLLSSGASYITGQNLVVDGGCTVW
ncbi:MAG TPA: SDR family oxidoreductase [Candidatus Hydrogenedentes bacterium]|nr:SDR family oxidoreductase [Candidatus Hydrogenedentota bacterium]